MSAPANEPSLGERIEAEARQIHTAYFDNRAVENRLLAIAADVKRMEEQVEFLRGALKDAMEARKGPQW
jgi:hypothetical protein